MGQTTEVFSATGRRKEAVARVRLISGSGNITVNKRPFEKYFIRETDRLSLNSLSRPLIPRINTTAWQISLGRAFRTGRGIKNGHLQGIAISRSFFKPLKKGSFLTRDDRMKERKKYGQKGARKRFQWTKR